ncbi:MAG TPA: glycine-rich protein, partial [Acidimicrobiales bacterium]|nr:glycine-rich protein [Acidimicrobiales bacterium]
MLASRLRATGSRHSGLGARLSLVTLAVALLASFAPSGLPLLGIAPASAASPCGANGTLSPSGTTCTYSTTGTDTFTVPPGWSALSVDSFGAQGTGGTSIFNPGGGAGGLGGEAKATFTVNPGDVLEVHVGAQGGGGPGGDGIFQGGGGTANNAGGAGGGASDVRTGSCASTTSCALTARVIVGGGGGGGGASLSGGAGGNGGGTVGAGGASAQSSTGGGGGNQTSGGSGGLYAG